MARELQETQRFANILAVGVFSPTNKAVSKSSYFEEFVNLIKSNGLNYKEIVYIDLRQIDPGFYITKGKVEMLIDLCKKHEIDEVIISELLSPQQERNLSEILHLPVYDRTQLILEIFEKGAQSAEGKLQIQIAMLQHRKSRLSGRGIHMSQQVGVIGMRGPGETAKEKEMRHLENAILHFQDKLKKLAQTRETQRKKRIGSGIPSISLVGYTNAGKSTILNQLTNANVLAENKLFATLDTTTRELYIDGKKKGVISDTVGFIQQIPHNLIEAFKSTLSELKHSDLLLHVIDLSDTNFEYHINVVLKILHEIGADKPMLYIFNKIDQVKNLESLKQKLEKYQPQVFVSAINETDLEPLINYLRNWNQKN